MIDKKYLRSIINLIKQDGECCGPINIQCDNCIITKYNKRGRGCVNYSQRFLIAQEELKKYTEEEIFEMVL